jgi:hypothetical protein
MVGKGAFIVSLCGNKVTRNVNTLANLKDPTCPLGARAPRPQILANNVVNSPGLFALRALQGEGARAPGSWGKVS